MRIPLETLNPDTLRNLIEEFVSREGTDYGEREYSMAEKIQQVHRQLLRGEAYIAFDAESETCSIFSA